MTLSMRHPTTTTDQTVSSQKKETGTSWYRSPFQRLAVLIHRLHHRHRHETEGSEQSFEENDAILMRINPTTQGNQSVRIKHVLASSLKYQDFEPIHPVREVHLSESEQSSPDSRI